MVPPASASIAMRCMTRTAVASKKLSTQRPISTNLMVVRSLSSIGSSSVGNWSSNNLSAVTSSSASVSSLGSSLSQLSLQKNNRQQHQINLFSSLAQNTNQPLGEPIHYLSLNNLADNAGAVKKKRRVGRGIGSSKGKTCGRGHKGQKARAGGGVHPTFEGGQTKFYKRLPKIGKMKNSKFKLELIPLNVGTVQDYITMGRLMPERADGVLTMKDFVNAGMFPNSSVKSGVKLLGDGKEFLKDKILIEVPWASASAIEAIEGKGGYVTCVHYNKLALRALLKPHKFPMKPETMLADEGDGDDDGAAGAESDEMDMHLLPKRARPPPKYMQYYTDFAKRGYLNPKVQLERKKRGLKDIL